MYSDAFCQVYNVFGWNAFPEAFGQQLLIWLQRNFPDCKTSLDLACGTGVLCRILQQAGLQAWGMDFSPGMIEIAREAGEGVHYDVADMITYRPEKQFDLVTCTGDALNHILDTENVERIFENVYACLARGGYFIFDLLRSQEISDEEPFDLDFSETVKARFQMTRGENGRVFLKTEVFEEGREKFREVITERLHDPEEICRMLRKSGFSQVSCADRLLEDAPRGSTTWFLIAKK